MARDMIKPVVIAFRLTDAEFKEVKAAHEAKPALGCRSESLRARKIFLDWARNKMRYLKPKDEVASTEPQVKLPKVTRNGSLRPSKG